MVTDIVLKKQFTDGRSRCETTATNVPDRACPDYTHFLACAVRKVPGRFAVPPCQSKIRFMLSPHSL